MRSTGPFYFLVLYTSKRDIVLTTCHSVTIVTCCHPIAVLIIDDDLMASANDINFALSIWQVSCLYVCSVRYMSTFNTSM